MMLYKKLTQEENQRFSKKTVYLCMLYACDVKTTQVSDILCFY